MTTMIRVWDRKLLNDFLDHIGDVNQRDERNGNTALIYAAHINHQGAVRRLLAAGADVNMRATSHNSHTALSEASCGGHINIVKALLAHPGINVNKKVGYGYTALMYAKHDASITRLLLGAGADPNLINGCGETALMRSFANADVAQILLEAGTNVNVANRIGETALFMPFPPQIMRAILEAKANVNHQSYSGCTPVIHAANRDTYENVNVLLGYRADPTLRANNGQNALQYARSASVYNLIRRNLNHRANLDYALMIAPHPVLNTDVLGHIGTFLGYYSIPGQRTVRDMIMSVQQKIHGD